MTLHLRLPMMTFPPIDPAQAAFIEKRLTEIAAHQPALRTLADILLGHGGLMVVPPRRPDPDVDALIARGQLHSTDEITLVPGQRSACHANVSCLWTRQRSALSIVVGYGLSADGLWRQHTWAAKGGRIIETTEIRVLYYGVVLAPNEAESFAACNP